MLKSGLNISNSFSLAPHFYNLKAALTRTGQWRRDILLIVPDLACIMHEALRSTKVAMESGW